MKINFIFRNCIICQKNPADSWEHVMPESIGGRLQIKALCAGCNKTLGSELISKVKEDPSIRLAVRNLRDEIPELFELIENGQLYNATDQNKNTVRLKYKKSKLEVLTQKQKNGSLNLRIKNIKQMLKKEGLSENEIADKIQFLQESEPNKTIQLSKTIEIGKWSIGQIFPSLQSPPLNERFVALMAYEFLSLLLGDLIYENQFHFMREFIRNGQQSTKPDIGHFMTRSYSTEHTIYPELQETETIINIILFGWLWYKVHIKGFRLASSDFVYLEDLKNKRPLYAKSVEEAKQSIWYEF